MSRCLPYTIYSLRSDSDGGGLAFFVYHTDCTDYTDEIVILLVITGDGKKDEIENKFVSWYAVVLSLRKTKYCPYKILNPQKIL